jgi:hypothetical protein
VNYYSPRQYRQSKEAASFAASARLQLQASTPGSMLVQAQNLREGDEVISSKRFACYIVESVETVFGGVRVHGGCGSQVYEANERLVVVRS